MMLLPMLFAPILLQAAAQEADKMPEPVAADSANIFYPPSKSLRSATAAAATGLPATPVAVRLQCEVASWGGPIACLPLESNARPVTSRAEWRKRQAAWTATGAAAASPAVKVAIERVRFIRVRAAEGATTAPPQMIFTEAVSASDAVTLGKPAGIIESRDLEMDERPGPDILQAYYPAAAIQAGVTARMKATCRVTPDRKLLCRDAELVSPDAAMTAAVASDFRNATYQVLDVIRLAPLTKQGDPVVGREIDMRISFVLPE